MENYLWTGLYAGWGWFLWFGLIVFAIFIVSNISLDYQSRRKVREGHHLKQAMGILDVRYAKGAIDQQEFHRMKTEIIESARQLIRESAGNSATPPLGSHHAHS